MPVRTPEVIRRTWGDELVAEVIPWIEQIIEEKAVPRDEYRQVLSGLDILEHDMADVKAGLRDLRREMSERFDRINERFDEVSQRMLAQTRWMVGTIALFGTLITILLAVSQLTP